MILGDARDLRSIETESVHLVVTSPPYFNLKPYASDIGGRQLGRIDDYDAFLDELDRVCGENARAFWVRSRSLGLDNLTPILWFKIGNRTNEAGGGSSGYHGKPYLNVRGQGQHPVTTIGSPRNQNISDHSADAPARNPARCNSQERSRTHRDAPHARRLPNDADDPESAVDVAA
jgi:hypothetical protein